MWEEVRTGEVPLVTFCFLATIKWIAVSHRAHLPHPPTGVLCLTSAHLAHPGQRPLRLSAKKKTKTKTEQNLFLIWVSFLGYFVGHKTIWLAGRWRQRILRSSVIRSFYKRTCFFGVIRNKVWFPNGWPRQGVPVCLSGPHSSSRRAKKSITVSNPRTVSRPATWYLCFTRFVFFLKSALRTWTNFRYCHHHV